MLVIPDLGNESTAADFDPLAQLPDEDIPYEYREFLVLTAFPAQDGPGIGIRDTVIREEVIEIALRYMSDDQAVLLSEWMDVCDVGDYYTWNTDLVVVRSLPFDAGNDFDETDFPKNDDEDEWYPDYYEDDDDPEWDEECY